MHTPGPWVLDKRSAGTFEVWPDTDEDCSSIAIVHADDEDEGMNARLIAAAPDLLEACIEVRRSMGKLRKQYGLTEDDSNQEWLGPQLHHMEDALEAAIAKATE